MILRAKTTRNSTTIWTDALLSTTEGVKKNTLTNVKITEEKQMYTFIRHQD